MIWEVSITHRYLDTTKTIENDLSEINNNNLIKIRFAMLVHKLVYAILLMYLYHNFVTLNHVTRQLYGLLFLLFIHEVRNVH